MQIVNKNFEAKYEIKKSTFFSHLVPFEALDIMRKSLKEKHPKARHIVWAYRTLNTFYQIEEYASDDGEPKGTAGVPVLNTMRGAELINVAILVVRYFGGIKLGTGGLVRAYGACANAVIENAHLLEYEPTKTIIFEIPYNLVRQFEYFFKNHEIDEGEKEFKALKIIWKTNLTSSQESVFLNFSKAFVQEGFKFVQ